MNAEKIVFQLAKIEESVRRIGEIIKEDLEKERIDRILDLQKKARERSQRKGG